MSKDEAEVIEGEIVPTPQSSTVLAPATRSEQSALVPDAKNIYNLAYGFFKSGLFPNTKSVYGAMTVIELGREIGLQPIIALNTINIIEGRPAMAGQAMLALIKSHGVDVKILQKDKKVCWLRFQRGAEAHFDETFTIEDAAAIKDKSGNSLLTKTNWKNFPEEMLFWRCVAKGARAYCSD